MASEIVTRFAPSPTGFLHVGGVRTALYAWLFAKKRGGTFILRIEDTDKEREVEGSVKHIMDSLRWLNLEWDFGPDKDGPWGSAVQSQRLNVYKKYAQRLIDKGLAYPDPYSEQELEAFRQQANDEKRPFLFRDHRPKTLEPWDGSKPLRFKVSDVKRYTWNDLVRGELTAGEEALDDFILIKSDGYPTYNFSHIVDDIEMGVTHVIRGEEFISSTPKFLSLYDALGKEPPTYATAPVILGPDGTKKLSKRDGAKDILDYRADGYLPEAMVNFLALLGWHPKEGSEVMSVGELIASFDIERVQKGGAKFDEEKLRWFNEQHIKRMSLEAFSKAMMELFGTTFDARVLPLVKERAHTLGEAAELYKEYDFLNGTISYSSSLLLNHGKIPSDKASQHLRHVAQLFEHIPDEGFTAEQLKSIVWPYADREGRGDVLWPLRAALSGKEKSPDPFTIAALLGREKSIERIAQALEQL